MATGRGRKMETSQNMRKPLNGKSSKAYQSSRLNSDPCESRRRQSTRTCRGSSVSIPRLPLAFVTNWIRTKWCFRSKYSMSLSGFRRFRTTRRTTSDMCRSGLKQQGLRLGGFLIVQIKLNEEPAQIRSEDRVRSVFFRREHVFDGTDVSAEKHLHITVVDGDSNRNAAFIVVGNERERGFSSFRL